MGYVATRRLRFGDGWIEPGEPVPVEEGRNYASLLAHGHIVEAKATENMSDEELVAEVQRLTAENETLKATPQDDVEVPDEVTPGVTPGWPIDATTGEPLSLTDEQRSALAEKEIGEGTEDDPVLAIVTHEGELVVIGGGESEEGEAGAEVESTDPAGAGSDAPTVDATDAAAKLAEAEKIDLSTVTGTGKDGRIVEGDVRKAIAERDA